MPGGRRKKKILQPALYTNSYANLVEPRLKEVTTLRLEGYSLSQIARYLNVPESSFHMWARKYVDLQQALMDGTAKIESQLEQAMIKSAKGYFYTEEKKTEVYDCEGNLTGTKVEKHRRWRPENTLLLTNLAKHMNKEKWDDEKDDKDIKIVLDEDLDEFAD